MEQENHYRHELKYAVSYSDYLALRSRLLRLMRADPHASADGKYRIRSVYFDNSDDKALREKINGVSKREKFRIRWYNDDLSYITLEKKSKVNNLCQKFDAVITEDEFRRILGGDTDFMKDHPNGLVRELYVKMKCQQLRPNRQRRNNRQAARTADPIWAASIPTICRIWAICPIGGVCLIWGV